MATSNFTLVVKILSVSVTMLQCNFFFFLYLCKYNFACISSSMCLPECTLFVKCDYFVLAITLCLCFQCKIIHNISTCVSGTRMESLIHGVGMSRTWYYTQNQPIKPCTRTQWRRGMLGIILVSSATIPVRYLTLFTYPHSVSQTHDCSLHS